MVSAPSRPKSPNRGGRLALLAAVVMLALALPAAVASAASEPGAAAIEPPSLAGGAMVARLVAPVFARSRPDLPHHGRPVSPETAWSGHPTTLLVLAAQTYEGEEWLQVRLPYRPDGSAGWIPRNDVVLGHTPYWVQVSIAKRQVEVYRDGHRLRTFSAVVGKLSTPTPEGLGAIYERNRQPDANGFEGPWILALTLLSNKLHSFEGGPGRVAIHGRGGASLRDSLGTAASHGCIRISNGPITWMASHVPVGTPVLIQP